MKYNININQLLLSKTSLDLVDCAILDWLIVYCRSVNPKIEDKREDGFTWVDYGQILSDNPLLRIKSRGAITPRIKKIEEEGFIIRSLKDGDKIFVKLTSKVDSLFIGEATVHENERYRSRKRTVTVHENERTIILRDNNTKTNSNACVASKEIGQIVDAFKEINPSYKKWFGNTTQREAAARLIETHGLDMVLKYIEALKYTNSQPYAPTVTTVLQLEDKLADLKAWSEKIKNKNTSKSITI